MRAQKLQNALPTLIKEQIHPFFAKRNVPIVYFGSFLRDSVLSIKHDIIQDLDCHIQLSTWTECLTREERSSFQLNDNHQRYIERLGAAGKPMDNRWLVYRPKCTAVDSVQPLVSGYNPLEISLLQRFVSVEEQVFESDIGLCQIASDGTDVYFSNAFGEDQNKKTLTVTRCKDVRDASRTLQRLEKLTQGHYSSYTPVWPEEFIDLRDTAIAEQNKTK